MSDTGGAVLQFGDFRLDVSTRELCRRELLSTSHLKRLTYWCICWNSDPERYRRMNCSTASGRTRSSPKPLTSVIAEIEVSPIAHVNPGSCEPCIASAMHSAVLISSPSAGVVPLRRSVCFARRNGRTDAQRRGQHSRARRLRDTIALNGATVSRRHARIVVAGDEATVEDLGSKSRTYLGGERLTAATRISDGDRLLIGSVPLVSRVHRSAETTRPRALLPTMGRARRGAFGAVNAQGVAASRSTVSRRIAETRRRE